MVTVRSDYCEFRRPTHSRVGVLGFTHRPEMAHGNGESDGQWSGTADHLSDRIARREHGKHQHEGDEQLIAECLSQSHSSTWSWSTQ